MTENTDWRKILETPRSKVALISGLVVVLALGLLVSRLSNTSPEVALTNAPPIVPTTKLLLTPSRTPAPTRTMSPTSTPNPLALGETLAICGYDLCVVSGNGSIQALGLSKDYDIVSRGEAASWSPDGLQITFVACAREYVLQFPKENCPIHVFVVNRDGTNVKRIPYEATNDYLYPTWSPDGEWIAFSHRCQLVIVHPDGSGWTDLGTYIKRPCPYGIAWSPDSQQIAWLGAESEDPNPRYLWVINSDDSGARLLQSSTEIAFAEAQIAWSPDGNSVAVQLTNGSTFLVDVNCPSSVTGCDESARTVIPSIPQHWLHTFYPQWAGEFEAPIPTSTPSSPGEAFSAAILAAIANRPPDFEDDFLMGGRGWQLFESYVQIKNGSLEISVPEGETYGSAQHSQMLASDFVFQVDVWADVLERDSKVDILLRENSPRGESYSVSLFPQQGGWWIYDHVEGTDLAQGSAPDVMAMGQWMKVVIIARGSQFAVFINDQLIDYFVDDTIPNGQNKVGVGGSGAGRADVKFDNVKFWNLANIPDLP